MLGGNKVLDVAWVHLPQPNTDTTLDHVTYLLAKRFHLLWGKYLCLHLGRGLLYKHTGVKELCPSRLQYFGSLH